MHVYFVRHGETYLNRKHIHQSPNTPLSPKGRDDARTSGEFLRGVNPDLIVSSEYTRALETARVIGLHVGLTPLVNGLFYEIERPSKFFGTSHFSLETLWYAFLSVLHRKNASWHYNDAENFVDVSNRAQRALAYIESLRGTHSTVVVVSHTIFINIMVSYMCQSKLLGLFALFRTFIHLERMKNGAVIHVEYQGKSTKNTCAWRLVGGV